MYDDVTFRVLTTSISTTGTNAFTWIFAKKTVVADVGFIPTTVPTVQSAVLTVADNGTSLGTITAPTTSTINKELLAGLTAKDFAVGDSLTVTVSQTSSAGAGLIVLYLRELP